MSVRIVTASRASITRAPLVRLVNSPMALTKPSARGNLPAAPEFRLLSVTSLASLRSGRSARSPGGHSSPVVSIVRNRTPRNRESNDRKSLQSLEVIYSLLVSLERVNTLIYRREHICNRRIERKTHIEQEGGYSKSVTTNVPNETALNSCSRNKFRLR